MKRLKNISVILFALFFLSTTRSFAQTSPVSVTLNSTSIPLYSVVEATFSLPETYTNPFDPAQIAVNATVTTPTGTTETVAGFWYENIALASTGSDRYTVIPNSGVWKVRYSPKRLGTYSLKITAQDPNSTYQSTNTSFTAIASQNKGFLEKDPTHPTRFITSNGDQFYAVGANLAWSTPNDFSQNFAKFNQNKMNFARIWMSVDFEPHFLLEWTGTVTKDNNKITWAGLGKYNQENAYKMDKMLEDASTNDVYIMLTLFTYHNFVDWAARNPYGSVVGSDPKNFWTSAEAKKYFKNFTRYIGARYGAYSHLGVYEFWNELDQGNTSPLGLTNGKDIMKNWHQEMTEALNLATPRKPLTSTSFAAYGKSWNDGDGTKSYVSLPSIDVASPHQYDSSANSTNMIAGWATEARWANGKFNRPYVLGEYGYGHNDNYGDTVLAKKLDRLNHHSTWAPIMLGGAASSSLHWRLNYVFLPPPTFLASYKRFAMWFDPELVHIKNMDFFWSGENLSGFWAGGYKNNNRAIVYFLSKAAKWDIDNPANITGVSYSVPLANGTYQIQFTDPYTGSTPTSCTPTTCPASMTISNGTLNLSLPTFSRDLAVKIFSSSGTVPTNTPSPTPTDVQTSPTPTYLRSDFGGLGGTKDGILDIQDFNILAGEFYQTKTSFKADIVKDTNNRVDIQDYNAFVSDYQAYLAR